MFKIFVGKTCDYAIYIGYNTTRDIERHLLNYNSVEIVYIRYCGIRGTAEI